LQSGRRKAPVGQLSRNNRLDLLLPSIPDSVRLIVGLKGSVYNI